MKKKALKEEKKRKETDKERQTENHKKIQTERQIKERQWKTCEKHVSKKSEDWFKKTAEKI